MQFLLLALLPALATAATVVDFATCDNVVEKLCQTDPECGVSGFTGASCKSDAGGAAPAPFGCCVGGTADGADTTTTAATTVAAGVTTTKAGAACVDKLNPMTGVSDCPARASLCTDSVYLDVMKDQCPKTCNFCSSTGTGSTNSTITSCVDLVNPSTKISDCPTMKIYCNNTIYQPLMRVQCPATCGFCTSG